jgi:hypothetical protein
MFMNVVHRTNPFYKGDKNNSKRKDVPNYSSAFLLLIFLPFIIFFVQCTSDQKAAPATFEFQKILASQSGLDFSNNLTPNVGNKFN